MLILSSQALALPGIAHGFFGRRGGVSTGIYASLNCGPGSGDSRDDIAENRRRALAGLGVHPPATQIRLVTLAQCHGADVRVVEEPWDMDAAPAADALATGRPGIALGILTADCAPVLFADPDARVIGAAHAGWKGALDGVLEAAIAAMEKLGAQRRDIRAAIGPCIGRDNYEVGPEFRERFLTADPSNARFFAASSRTDHHHFDLPSYVAHRLAAAGTGTVEGLSTCTYAGSEDFFSFRRATHRVEGGYGRELSAIMLDG